MQWILQNPEATLGILSIFVGYVIWQVRLEGRVNYQRLMIKDLADRQNEQAKELADLRARQESTDGRIATELKSISIKLAHIEGYLTAKKQNRTQSN